MLFPETSISINTLSTKETHMHRSRTFILLALLLTGLLLFGACTAPAAAPADTGDAGGDAEAGPTTITWAFWGSPEEAASHERVAEIFMEGNPDIQIETFNEPWGDYFTKVQALWASGDSEAIPDVLFLWPTPRYAAEGVLENLDSYIEESGYNLDDYWPGLLESASYEGSVYGFPRDIGFSILYYNKDLFDAAGVEYPTENWRWDDLAAAAEALTVTDDNGRTTQYGLAIEGGKYAEWILENNGGILDDLVNPSTCTLNQPEAVAGIQYFSDLLENGYAMRDADLSQAGGDAGVFLSGQAAMIIQNASRISAFNEAGMNYDVAVVPYPEGGKRWASAGGAAWVMSSGSDNKDAAWTFLEWLQSTDGGQMAYTESGEIFPALKSVAQSDAFLNQDQPPENRQAFLVQGESSDIGSFGYFPEWGELDGSIIGPGLQQIWAGERTPEDVLPEICEQVNAFLAENGYPK